MKVAGTTCERYDKGVKIHGSQAFRREEEGNEMVEGAKAGGPLKPKMRRSEI